MGLGFALTIGNMYKSSVLHADQHPPVLQQIIYTTSQGGSVSRAFASLCEIRLFPWLDAVHIRYLGCVMPTQLGNKIPYLSILSDNTSVDHYRNERPNSQLNHVTHSS